LGQNAVILPPYSSIMPNRLISEQSPYLLQHAHNPVDWYPWGDEAFEKAREEHKPVIVSIGYAACHWCHVMEHESFESEEVAAFMNQHFICVKVDREEHPDVDHFYMDAIQALSGSGGWPLNAFVTPGRVPFYGGTYYPPRPAFNRPSWMQLLHRIVELWHQQVDEVIQQADQMVKHLQQASQRSFAKSNSELNMDMCRAIADNLLAQADKEKGGFGNAPKFPGTMAISYLIEHYHFTGYEPALQQALRSLDAMIEGGIYDQLGGGFARYATDRDWLIPHFEKMLYDNALIVSSLCDAYQVTKDERYRIIADETIAFVERELKDKTGGYYCAIDADSEGVEGKFYTFTWEEWLNALDGNNDEVAASYFGVSEHGNWEETNILHVAKSMAEVAADFNITIQQAEQRIQDIKCKLLVARDKRIRPITDDKSLLSWNALMNIALSKAGVAFKNEQYLARASAQMSWMLNSFNKGTELLHVWKQGVAKIPAKLDDHAYLVQALLQLATATAENKWVLKADELTEQVIRDFSREDGFFYYTSAAQADVPVRKVDVYDGATPSANALMAHNLQIIGMCMDKNEWVLQSASMLQHMSDMAVRYGYSFGYWAIVLQRKIKGVKTVICTGPEATSALKAMQNFYLPHAYVLASQEETALLPVFEKKVIHSKNTLFVCTEQACLPPVTSIDEAFRLVNQ
jgi:uncharacterized protein YyaL (SSP411 family)